MMNLSLTNTAAAYAQAPCAASACSGMNTLILSMDAIIMASIIMASIIILLAFASCLTRRNMTSPFPSHC